MSNLPDLSGSMRYVPELLNSEQVLVNSTMSTLYTQVYNVDMIIYQYAYALEVIQPPVTGKIAVRFLKRKRAGSNGRHPQIVQWYKSRSGRFLYTRLKQSEAVRKVKGYAIFAPVEGDVKILLKEAIACMEHREKLLDLADNLRRQCAVVSSKSSRFQGPKLAQVQEWLPLLAAEREKLVGDWRRMMDEAELMVPRDGVVEDRAKPRVAIIDKTRGKKHETHRGNR